MPVDLVDRQGLVGQTAGEQSLVVVGDETRIDSGTFGLVVPDEVLAQKIVRVAVVGRSSRAGALIEDGKQGKMQRVSD